MKYFRRIFSFFEYTEYLNIRCFSRTTLPLDESLVPLLVPHCPKKQYPLVGVYFRRLIPRHPTTAAGPLALAGSTKESGAGFMMLVVSDLEGSLAQRLLSLE